MTDPTAGGVRAVAGGVGDGDCDTVGAGHVPDRLLAGGAAMEGLGNLLIVMAIPYAVIASHWWGPWIMDWLGMGR